MKLSPKQIKELWGKAREAVIRMHQFVMDIFAEKTIQ